MSQTASSPQPILVVGDEEVFAAFLQHFPASSYLILFASGAAEAMVLCESNSPRLMVVPLDGGGVDLTSALRAVDHAGGKILGLRIPGGPEGGAGACDKEVPSDDSDTVITAARELLQERRQHPRVVVEFPVWFGANRQGLARDLSSQSLVIETTERLKPGEPIDLELHWSDVPKRIATTVERVKPLDMGHYSIQLLVREDDQGARAYLGEVIRKILEVEHYLHALQPGRLAVRGRAAWNLARRAEESLQHTAELGLSRDVDPGAAQSAAAPTNHQGSLQTRYNLGASRGRWGIGEVYEAEHRLLRRRVLVKQLTGELRQDPTARSRMEAEATAASAVRSDCIADVLDFGEDGEGGLFYAMEWLNGETLTEALSSKTPFSVQDIARLGVHLSFALTVAHRQGVRHWDLCAEHVFLNGVDSGLATPKLLSMVGAPQAPAEAPPHALGLACRPPGEAGEQPSVEWDVFALCRMLGRIQATDGASGQGERLRALFTRGTSSDASRRFGSMSLLCRALNQILLDVEKAPGTGTGAHIVPAILPGEASLFRMSSTGLAIPSDAPAAQSWPRAQAIATTPDATRTPAPSLPPAGRVPKAKALKKTLYGVHAAAALPVKPSPEADTRKPPEPAPEPAPALSRAPAPAPGAAPQGSPADPKGPVVLPPELELNVGAPDLEDFEEATTNVVPLEPTGQKKTLYGVTALRPRSPAPPNTGPTPESRPASVPLTTPVRAEPKPMPTAAGAAPATLFLTAPVTPVAPIAPVLPAALAARGPTAPSLSARGPAAPGPTAPGPTAPGPAAPAPAPTLSPADLIASAIAEDPSDELALGAQGPIPDGQAPLHVDDPLAVPGGTMGAMGAPSFATPPRRHFPWLFLAIGLLLLGGIAAGLYFLVFIDRTGDAPRKKGNAPAQGAPRDSRPAARDRPVRQAPPPRDAGTISRTTPPREASRPDAGTLDAATATRDAAAPTPEPPRDEHVDDAHLSPRERERLAKKRRLAARLALINKARAMMRQGRHTEARKTLTDALHMWDSPRLRSLFAQSHAATGETWPAIHHQRRAVALSPSSATEQLALGRLYLKVGQRSQACAAFRAARASKPDDAQTPALLKRYCGG